MGLIKILRENERIRDIYFIILGEFGAIVLSAIFIWHYNVYGFIP